MRARRVSRAQWEPAAIVETAPLAGAYLCVPLEGRDNAFADAIYSPVDATLTRWRLDRVEEWLPPMSPQEKARQFTDAYELPPLTADGRIDFDAIRDRREREWEAAGADS